ncbi:MAG: hypothetical protein LBL60_03700 [Mycoplasmataceae bacterium]|nr:hypothetical protein [Mycoplasmataceae bacterium]
MNFIAIIGIVKGLMKGKTNEYDVLKVKVDKPFIEKDCEDWYELIDVNLDSAIFKREIKSIKNGAIVGIKGRISQKDNQMLLIGERLQVY